MDNFVDMKKELEVIENFFREFCIKILYELNLLVLMLMQVNDDFLFIKYLYQIMRVFYNISIYRVLGMKEVG